MYQRTSFAIAAIALAVLATGCSNGDDEEGVPDSPSTSTSAPSSSTSTVVGEESRTASPTTTKAALDGGETVRAVVQWLLEQQAAGAKSIEDQAASGALTGEDLERMRTSVSDNTLSPEEARCYASTIVEKVGPERVVQMGLTGSPPSSASELGPKDTAAIRAADHCRHNWKVRIFKYSTQGSERIS